MLYLGLMAAMDHFEALITSFGESLVMHVGRDRVRRLEVRGYEGSETADVLVWLLSNSWDDQLAAMTGIEEVRMIFLGDLSFEYRLLDEKEDAPEARVAAVFSLTR